MSSSPPQATGNGYQPWPEGRIFRRPHGSEFLRGLTETNYLLRGVSLTPGQVVFGINKVIEVTMDCGNTAVWLAGSSLADGWGDRGYVDFLVFLGVGGRMCRNLGLANGVFWWRGTTWVPCRASGRHHRYATPLRSHECAVKGDGVSINGIGLCMTRLIGVKHIPGVT